MTAKSKLVLNILSGVAVALSLAGLALAIVALLTGNDTDLALFPEDLMIALGVFCVIVFFVSVLGIVGGATQSKVATVAFVVLDLLLAFVFIIMVVFLVLYANNISTTSGVDDVLGSEQEKVERRLVEQAMGEPEEWKKYQKTFECCGVDFEASYNATFAEKLEDVMPSTQSDYIERLHPGEKCKEGRKEILALQETFPTYNEDAEEEWAKNEVIGDGTDYFCKWRVSTLAQENTTYIAVVAGLLVLFQIVMAVSALILLFKVHVDNGGFVENGQKKVQGKDMSGTNGRPEYHD